MKKKIIVLFLVITLIMSVVTACGSKKSVNSNEKAVKQEQYVPVAVEEVQEKTISKEITFSGKVHANKEVMVVPKIPGKIASIKNNVGAKVQKDSVLFTLDKDDVQKQVEKARKTVDAAKANYIKTKESIENAKANFERTKELYEQGAVSKSQYEQAELAASDSSLAAVRAQYEQAEIALNQALDSLKDTSVKSPIDGIVSVVNIEEGEMASNAQPAMTIIDMDKVYVELDIAENIINDLYLGQEVVVEIPSAYDETITGKIDRLSPAADPRTQLYSVRVYIENKEHKIKPGMFSKIKLNTEVRENVIAVKSESVLQKEGKIVVYLVEDNKAVEREVKIGLDTGNLIEIVEGINKGETIITKGQNYVENGSIVKVVRGDK
ncbi:efflux RND transporter periplasmic adaptor subunit [Maledivibacter halophilus]|uniref:RND family efflux transporter, MFP subunit n=1 Tax=Maledivibacter halophilus TaxID=36842 RepID=A0A1T5M4Z5_9FIRM|nr:efflux RND transporter periplasmic adaptor subunit [Maledivibacter halophilus]SKC83195.1 RND family efflux transporter, MFP subunit [Maledivibacter halophilus]